MDKLYLLAQGDYLESAAGVKWRDLSSDGILQMRALGSAIRSTGVETREAILLCGNTRPEIVSAEWFYKELHGGFPALFPDGNISLGDPTHLRELVSENRFNRKPVVIMTTPQVATEYANHYWQEVACRDERIAPLNEGQGIYFKKTNLGRKSACRLLP